MFVCALLTILLRPKTSQILSTGGTVIGTTCDVISSALRLWRSVCLYIHPAWVVCHLSLLTGSEGLGCGVSGRQPALFLWTYPEIRTCWIDLWWHSLLLVMHHPRRSNSLLAGRKKLPKPTRLSSADFTRQSNALYWMFYLLTVALSW